MIQRIAAVAACTIVAVGIVLAFGVLGSPDNARLIALDQHRVADLNAIVEAIYEHRASTDPATAPVRLAEIEQELMHQASIHDPVTGKLYEYDRRSALRYELCATFALPSEPDADNTDWKHRAGRSCRWFVASAEPVEP